jgi:hypothetical protein
MNLKTPRLILVVLLIALALTMSPRNPVRANDSTPAPQSLPNDPPSLTTDEFTRHYCEMTIIRYIYRDDPVGFSSAIEAYLDRTGITLEEMKAFVTARLDDVPFWIHFWDQVENLLKDRLDTPDKK